MTMTRSTVACTAGANINAASRIAETANAFDFMGCPRLRLLERRWEAGGEAATVRSRRGRGQRGHTPLLFTCVGGGAPQDCADATPRVEGTHVARARAHAGGGGEPDVRSGAGEGRGDFRRVEFFSRWRHRVLARAEGAAPRGRSRGGEKGEQR